MGIKVTVVRVETGKCDRCWRHDSSVGQIKLYPELCCICAYDIHHGICENAHLFKKEGSIAVGE